MSILVERQLICGTHAGNLRPYGSYHHDIGGGADTVFALASGFGRAGVAVIRISGAQSHNVR